MKKILLGLVLVFATTGAFAQCTAAFQDTLYGVTPNPYDVLYTNLSTPTNGTYDWTFAGGTPSSANNVNYSYQPIVSYPGPGTYSVWLIVYDSNASCVDSTVSTVTIPGNAVSCLTNTTNATCGLCDGTASVSPSGGVAPYSYLWSNGDTTATINNECVGTYTVTVTDAFAATTTCTAQIQSTGSFPSNIYALNNNTCPGDSITIISSVSGGPHTYLWSNGSNDSSITVGTAGMYKVTVSDTNGCSVVDSLQATFINAFSLSTSGTGETCINCCDGSASSSVSGSGGYTYLWSTNATTSSISGLCPGTYTVTVTDSNGCMNSSSYTVGAFTCYSISGNVDQGMEPTRVYLIEENNNFLTAVDSTVTDSLGNYLFSGVCMGTYYVKAALLPAHTSYSAFLPTYYDTVALWSQANALIVAAAGYSNIDIYMLSGTNNGGPGFVGGLISQGANRDEGDPIANAQMVLTNENDEVIDFTKSGQNGTYTLDDLPYGSYKLYVDLLNKTSYPLTFTLSEDQPNVENGNFKVYADYIKPELPTGIDQASTEQHLMVYPNPSEGILNLESKEVIQSVKIYSLQGKELRQQNPASERVQLQLGDLSTGTYILHIQGENFSTHHVWMKE